MPVAATVEGDAPVAALIARFDVPAEGSSPAQLDRRHDTALSSGQRCVLGTIGLTVATEYIRHFRPRTDHREHRNTQVWRAGAGWAPDVAKARRGYRSADLVGGDAQVMGGGREAAVTKQQLNGAYVGAGLEEMDGEGVPQAVRCHRFGQAGKIVRFRAGLPNCIPADRVAGAIARKEPRLWPPHPPIVAQDLQELGRQHHIAVLLALTLLDTDDHSLAVDIRGLQLHRFRNAQTGGIAGGQDGVVFEIGHAAEKVPYFIRTEDDRQLLGLLGKRQYFSRHPILSSVTLKKKRNAEMAI